MLLSPFNRNFCSCRNLNVGDSWYLMFMSMSLLESECVNTIFDVDEMWGLCHIVLMSISACYTKYWICARQLHIDLLLFLNLHLNLIANPPFVSNTLTPPKHKRDITHLCETNNLNALCHCNLVLYSLGHCSLPNFIVILHWIRGIS